MKRNCDNCSKEYEADQRNVNRGWGLCCSKSCASQKREKNKPSYNSERTLENNIRRENWNRHRAYAPMVFGTSGRVQGHTDEGYVIVDGVAYNEWDEPVYDV